MLYELCLRCGQFRFVPGMYCLDCGYIPPKLLDSDCVFRRMFSQPNNGRRDYFRREKTGFWRKIAIGVYSFASICETLQLHPDYIGQGLLRWKEARRKISSFQENTAGSPTLVKTRVARTSVRLSKTV